MEKVLNEGRQIIVLIPEISLTLQTVSRFYARFGSQIAVMNSRLQPENGMISICGPKGGKPLS